jgi:hypothetical protein
MDAQTSGGIALRTTGNLQGGVYFMSLDTGKIINRAHWIELPVPVEVIKRVNELGRSTGEGSTVQWEFLNGDIINDDALGENKNVNEIHEDEFRADNAPENINEPIVIEGVQPIDIPIETEVPDVRIENGDMIEIDAVPEAESEIIDLIDDRDGIEGQDPKINVENNEDIEHNEGGNLIETDEESIVENEQERLEREMDERYGVRNNRYDL